VTVNWLTSFRSAMSLYASDNIVIDVGNRVLAVDSE